MKTSLAITLVRRTTPAGLAALALLAGIAAGGCRPRYSPGESDTLTCSNGFDDDLDGLTDCADPSCAFVCGGGGSDSGLPGNCGDGIVDTAEECDGKDLAGESCVSLGFDGGDLYCTAFCTYETIDCTTAGGCGDGLCGAGETCTSCPSDCGACSPTCGDDVCSGTETCSSCPTDCGACCGNGLCGTGETCTTCPSDCGTCAPTCGDFTCSGTETCSSCPTDCGACCGNGICGAGETCSTCSLDCGTCSPVCGDFSCSGTETCSTCPTDCGSCGGTTTYDWDTASLQGWTASNTCTGTGWRYDSYRSVSPSYSLYYGSPTTRNYDCAGVSNSGTASSPSCTLDTVSPSLSFSVWMATEGSASYDLLTLYVVAPAGTYAIWNSGTDLTSPGSTGGVFVTETVSLSSYAGDYVYFYFEFATGDSVSNTYEGVYIDEFSVDC